MRFFCPQSKLHLRLPLLLTLLACASAVIAPVSFSQTSSATSTEPYAAARTHAHAVGNELLARGIPGLSVAVAVDGHLVYAEGFGYADLEQRVSAWPTTKYRIGSISKPLTAVGLVQLVERGKLDLDAPVQKYVPSFPDKGTKITARLLAGHLAGIRHYQGDEIYISKHYDKVIDGLAIFENDPLASPPGTAFHYSSYGFNLLSAVMESAAGEDFLSYMQKNVFTPMGLIDTIADQNRAIIPQRARFYEREKDGPIVNAAYVDSSYKWAGGGFLSTPEDLVRFGSLLLHPGFLSENALHMLFTSQKTSAGQETGYGMGFFIRKSESGQRVYEHAGGSIGASCQLIVYPDSHVVIAMLTNGGLPIAWKASDVESIAEPFASR
jgi:CubicO group peptidase (beta-lactamase class C family)